MLATLLPDSERLAALGRGAVRVATEMSVARHVDRLETILATAMQSAVRAAAESASGRAVACAHHQVMP